MVEPVSDNSDEQQPERHDDSDPPQRPEDLTGEESEQSDTQDNSRKGKKKQRSFWKELPILIVVALVLAFVIQHFFARVYMIPSGSMMQTLQVGDRILVDKITYNFSAPEPGDVVVFEGPPTWVPRGSVDDSDNAFVDFLQSIGSVFGLAPPDEKDFVKRIIATGGQTISCCDDKGRVTVNGDPLKEPYIYWPPGVPHVQKEFGPVTVPEGSVWVMGDNRTNSADSRFQGGGGVAGTVPVEYIIGEARLIVLPPSRWQTIDDPNPQKLGQHAMALPAPLWQQSAPLALGALAAWPTLAVGRRLTYGTRRRVRRRRR